MSSLEAALYAYSLEESWDARLRKWKTGSGQQVLECRTLTRDTRDHLLYLIQDAEEEGNREQATIAGYAYLRGRDRLLALRIGQRERRGRPDDVLSMQRELLRSLIEVLEPHVPPTQRQAIEKFLEGQAAPEPPAGEPGEAAPAPEAAPTVDAKAVQELLDDNARLKSRLEMLEEGKRRLETEFPSGDSAVVIETARELRSRLTETETRLAPLTVERDALAREFGSFTATQIISQVRLLKDRNAESYSQIRQLQTRLEVAEHRLATPEPITEPEPEPPCPECEAWQAERESLERALIALERTLGLPGK